MLARGVFSRGGEEKSGANFRRGGGHPWSVNGHHEEEEDERESMERSKDMMDRGDRRAGRGGPAGPPGIRRGPIAHDQRDRGRAGRHLDTAGRVPVAGGAGQDLPRPNAPRRGRGPDHVRPHLGPAQRRPPRRRDAVGGLPPELHAGARQGVRRRRRMEDSRCLQRGRVCGSRSHCDEPLLPFRGAPVRLLDRRGRRLSSLPPWWRARASRRRRWRPEAWRLLSAQGDG